jgi:Na+/melibiose symporter-like transporter
MHAAAWMLGGAIIGWAAIGRFRTARNPLLDLSSLRVPTYAVTVLWGSATRIGIEAVPYLAPLLFQVGFGLSAFDSGLLLLATAVGNLGMKVFTSPILRTFGFRRVAVAAVSAAGLCIGGYGWLRPSTPVAVVLLVLTGYGVARSMQFTTLATLAYADIADEQKARASTLWSVAQQMTIGMGIAFGALCLRVAAHFNPGAAGGHAAFTVEDFHWAFLAAGGLVLVSSIGYRRLRPDAGRAFAAGGADTD